MKLILPFLLLTTSLFGQKQTDEVIPLDLLLSEHSPFQKEIIAKLTENATPGTTSNSNKKEEKSPEDYRKEFLTRLKFDRTPSGILEAERKRRLAEATPEKPEAKTPEPNDPDKVDNPEEKKERSEEELKQLQAQYKRESEELQSNVILGLWDDVSKYLQSLPPAEAKSTYTHILSELAKPVRVTPRPEVALLGAKAHSQQNYLKPEDVLALAEASPFDLEAETTQSLAKLLPSELPQTFIKTLKSGTRYFGSQNTQSKFLTSALLLNHGSIQEAFAFLPELNEAREAKNNEVLNLLARFHAQAHQNEFGTQHLPLAWEISLEVMSSPEATAKESQEALYRALSLVSELDEGSGQDWLRNTFSDPAGEGFKILAAVGIQASQSRKVRAAPIRLQQCKLQYSAVEALLETEGLNLSDWQEIFTIYALNWLEEADLSNRLDTSVSRRPELQSDRYGNSFYMPRQYQQNRNSKEPNPIPTGELIELTPPEKWLSNVDETVRLQLLELIPTLLLKVKEHEKAFPLIENLASEKPEAAERLVRNMISVWAENHNPNQQNRYRNSYSYFYGSNRRAESIPLTRSKQERNLKELAGLVSSIRKLDLEESFNEELANAFITVHSQAEVWRVEALQSVFGELSSLDSDTVASLIDKMRINLAALWPDPKLQEEAKTKRTDKERHQQVLEGYKMAREVTAQAWAEDIKSPNLLLQLAALVYEESNYLSAMSPQSSHSSTKRTSLDDMAGAAQLYAASLPLEKQSDESTAVYETWFFSALGSPLLEALKNHHMPVRSEFAKIKAALDKLPDGILERHYNRFAKTLNTRLANVAPDLKYRYLESALQIIGDNPEAETARAVFDYYKDLVTEIQLLTAIDGSSEVGTEPFGLYVNLHHTKEIERESGGFQKYLQNQNNVSYSYNFGRPTEDYRDKFEKASRAALEEHFEVISLTFHTDKIESRTSPRTGWRHTPMPTFY